MSGDKTERALRRAAPWAIGLGCVVAAWFVALITPSDTAAWAPFVVEARADEPAAGRNLIVAVEDVTRAEAVTAADGWRAEGSWVVVDISAEAVTDELRARLVTAQLVVDGRAYRATERRPSMIEQSLSIGVPQTGSVGFELPADATGPAVLQFALNADTRADSLIEYRFDLEALPVVAEREILDPDREDAS